MTLLREVEMDQSGRVMLAPEVCKRLWAAHPPDEKTMRLQCLFDGLRVVLVPKDGDRYADWEIALADLHGTAQDEYLLRLADPQVQLRDALAATAKIKGSLAAEAVAEREERF